MRALRNLWAAVASALRISALPGAPTTSHLPPSLSIMDAPPIGLPRHVAKSRKARKARKARAFAKSQRQKLIWR